MKPSTVYSAGAPSGRYVWYVVVLLSVVNMCNYMDRMALSVLMPSIQADLHLSDAQLGLLAGFAFFVFYAICGIPIARLADRGVRRNIIALALVTWSVMTAMCGFAQQYWHLFAARVGVGVGEAGCLPPAQSILCDYVPARRRAGIFAIHNFGLLAGMMFGMAIAGTLGEMVGWRWTFIVLGIPGIALAFIVMATLREPERGYFDSRQPSYGTSSIKDVLKALWHCRTYRLLTGFVAMNGFVLYGFYQWLPSFYARVFDLKLSTVGMYLGVVIGVGSGIGLLLGGLLANKVAQRNVGLPLTVGAAATCLALPAVVGALFVPHGIASMGLMLLTVMLWSVSNGPAVAATFSATQPHMRATAGALQIFMTSLLGFGLGPFCVGLLSDVLTPSFGSQALRYALLAPACLIPFAALGLHKAAKTMSEDLVGASAQAVV